MAALSKHPRSNSLNPKENMSENSIAAEQHGCIVCGRIYSLLVIYDPDGRLVDCTVTSPGGHRVVDSYWPLAACNRHTEAEIKTALANHYPGKAKEDLEDD
jgi:hypothetical protein